MLLHLSFLIKILAFATQLIPADLQLATPLRQLVARKSSSEKEKDSKGPTLIQHPV